MRKCSVTTPEQALAYLTDCTLATVCGLAMKTRRPKHEFERQISIAQSGIDWMRQMGVNFDETRARYVCDMHKGSVQSWADEQMRWRERQ